MLKIFSQQDPKWSQLKIGQSNVTIGKYGCTLTCLTMIAYYLGKLLTPDLVMKSLKFTNDGLLIWNSIDPKTLGFMFMGREYYNNETKIKQYLKDPNTFVILEVNKNHWVWALSKSIFGGYNIADPFTGIKTTTKKYGNNITGVAYFRKV